MKLLSLLLLQIIGLSTGFSVNTASSACSNSQTTSTSRTELNVESSTRRNFCEILPKAASAAFLSTVSASVPAFAEDLSSLTYFQDESAGFQIKHPNWEMSEQKLPDRRRLVLFVDNADSTSNEKDLMFIAYTPVRDDFTALSSFGSVDEVAQSTILPKGALMGEDNESKMLSAESKKNSYYFDYVAAVPGQPKRHFQTIFTLIQGGTGGAGSVLVTITIQTTESKYDANKKQMFDEIIESFGKLKK